MDTALIHKKIDSLFASRETVADGKKKKKKKAPARKDLRVPAVACTRRSLPAQQIGTLKSICRWLRTIRISANLGQYSLEDNWRRSTKSGAGPSTPLTASGEVTPTKGPVQRRKKASKVSAALSAFKGLLAQLPRTDTLKKQSLAKIEEAYFKLGDLYYFQLMEKENAQGSYEQLF